MTILIAAAAAFAALPPAAQPDAQCLMVYTAAAGIAKTDADRLPALLGTAYFYGRIEAVAPSVNVTDLLQDLSVTLDKMEQPKLQVLGESCDKRFQAMGKRFEAAGETLKK